MWRFIHQFASTKYMYGILDRWQGYVGLLFALLFIAGLIGGLYLAPADYQQGDAFRIIYIHVPSAFVSMGIYMIMASCALVFLVWRIKLAAIWLVASAPIGASFALFTLITGSIWGKPMWGTWWIWDARLTSALILFFLYLGYMALQSAFSQREQGDKAGAVIVLLGVVNIPIIHYSVQWWNTLHQGATLSRFAKPAMDSSMLYPLLIMISAFFVFYLWAVCQRVKNEIIRREGQSQWLQQRVLEND